MTKRKIANKIDELEGDRGTDNTDCMVMNLAHVKHPNGKRWPDMEDSPHPELTIKPYPEQKPNSLKIAVPTVIPEEFRTGRIIFVEACAGDSITREGDGTPDTRATTACELWEAMSDEQLEEEHKIRQERGESIPDLLADRV